MPESVFREILDDMLGALPHAHGAVFADWEGEAVDHVSIGATSTQIRLVGAHWGIIYFRAHDCFERSALGASETLVLRFTEEQIVVRHVEEGYYVVVASGPQADLALTLCAVDAAIVKIREQM